MEPGRNGQGHSAQLLFKRAGSRRIRIVKRRPTDATLSLLHDWKKVGVTLLSLEELGLSNQASLALTHSVMIFP